MRHFLFLSTLTVAFTVSAFASVDSGLLALLPSNAKIIGAVDVTRARNSDFGQYLLNKAQTEDDHFQEMLDQTGFDPRRDLQSILFATSGPTATGQPSSFAILARGNFDANRIKSTAKAKGAGHVISYGGLDIIVDPEEAGQRPAIAFPEVGVAVMADLTTLKQVIDNRASATVLDPDLVNKINTLGSANDAWFVSLVGGSVFAHHTGSQNASQARAFEGVVQSSGGVKLGPTVDTTLDAVTRSPQDATSLSDVIRFMASMVQMQRENDPHANILATALDGMTLQNAGTAVHFSVSMPEKSLEELAETAPHANAH